MITVRRDGLLLGMCLFFGHFRGDVSYHTAFLRTCVRSLPRSSTFFDRLLFAAANYDPGVFESCQGDDELAPILSFAVRIDDTLHLASRWACMVPPHGTRVSSPLLLHTLSRHLPTAALCLPLPSPPRRRSVAASKGATSPPSPYPFEKSQLLGIFRFPWTATNCQFWTCLLLTPLRNTCCFVVHSTRTLLVSQ